jgi:hypothetical protein
LFRPVIPPTVPPPAGASAPWQELNQPPDAATTVSLTVAGWSGGLLVQFAIHGGRLCHWSQRTCSRPAATGALAATPAAWRDFTQRNAELAASLAQHH